MDYPERPKLQAMRCPTCGGMLDGENGREAIQCVYCGNTVIPVEAQSDDKPRNEAAGGVVRIEGMRSPSSALAYVELFFEEYDWDAFLYSPSFSVSEIDDIAESMKVSSADDKNTWILHFKSVSVPYINKIKGCAELLNKIVEKHKNGSDDAYSAFDAYRRVASGISVRRATVLRLLGDYLTRAEKYGAGAEEISELKAEVGAIEKMHAFPLYENIKEIPEISRHSAECDARIASALAAQGINAEVEYANAKQYLATGRYVEALSALEKINGYSDSEELIEKANKYFVMSDVLEIGGRLYFFRANKAGDVLSLCPVENGVATSKNLIKNIKQVVTNYGDILYYVSADRKFIRHDFRTGTSAVIVKCEYDKVETIVYGDKIYVMYGYFEDYNTCINLVEVEASSGNSRVLFERLTSEPYIVSGKLVCTVPVGGNFSHTAVVDLDTQQCINFTDANITLKGVYEDTLIYTRETPNEYNMTLFARKFEANAPEIIIEENIYEYVSVVKGKIYYNIGGDGNRSLIIANLDGSNRTERTLFATNIHFNDDEWVYYTRTLRSNSVLCRAHIDGTGERIIARDVRVFHDITNGYLHYTNKSGKLIRVRMDGSNSEVLCDSVGEVLAISENRIVFSSNDAEYREDSYDSDKYELVYVTSIYAVDFESSGRRKLVYDIRNAKKYNDETVYYTKRIDSSSYDSSQKIFFKMYALDITSGKTRELVTFDKATTSGGCYVATAVYGSYDCPEVWTLRRFRDIKLAASWYGRAFIKMYYAISPTLVKWFGDCGWFKKLWKGRLDKMVEKLREEGFESTPYNDK